MQTSFSYASTSSDTELQNQGNCSDVPQNAYNHNETTTDSFSFWWVLGKKKKKKHS